MAFSSQSKRTCECEIENRECVAGDQGTCRRRRTDVVAVRVDAVEEAGYEAICASNADEAIAILNARDDIKIIFTDIRMPGSMDGMKLAAAARNRWPPIEIIVTSGHLSGAPLDLPERGRFFCKPYRTEHIVDALRELAG